MDFNAIVDVPDDSDVVRKQISDIRIPSKVLHRNETRPSYLWRTDAAYIPGHIIGVRGFSRLYKQVVLRGVEVTYSDQLDMIYSHPSGKNDSARHPITYIKLYRVTVGPFNYPWLRELSGVIAYNMEYVKNRNLYKVSSMEVVEGSRVLEYFMNPNLAVFESDGPLTSLKSLENSNLRKLHINFGISPFSGDELKYLPKTMRILELYHMRDFNSFNFRHLTNIPLTDFEINSPPVNEEHLLYLPWKTLRRVTFISNIRLSIPSDGDTEMETYMALQPYHERYPDARIFVNHHGYEEGIRVTSVPAHIAVFAEAR